MVLGPLAATIVSIDFCPSASLSFTIFSKAVASGSEAQTVACELRPDWAKTPTTKTNARKIAQTNLDIGTPSRLHVRRTSLEQVSRLRDKTRRGRCPHLPCGAKPRSSVGANRTVVQRCAVYLRAVRWPTPKPPVVVPILYQAPANRIL